MKPKPNHDQGIILATRPFMQKERPLTQAQKEALKAASGEIAGIRWKIRTVKAPQPASASTAAATRYGRRLSLGTTCSSDADSQRRAWIGLLVSAAKASSRK